MMVWAAPVAALLAASSQAADVRTLFSHRARVERSSAPSTLQRVDLPIDVVSQCDAQLSDLRVLAENGREIPYQLLVPTPREPGPVRQSLRVVSANRDTVRNDNELPQFLEQYVLQPDATLPAASNWSLVFESPSPEFVRHVRVELRREGQAASTWVSEGSVFAIASMQARRTELPLGDLRDVERIEVRFEGRDSAMAGYLAPRFHLESRPDRAVPQALGPQSSGATRQGNTSVVELKRPLGFVPAKLVFKSASQLFSRTVRVYAQVSGQRDELVGSGRIFRIPRDSEIFEQLEVPVSAADASQLRILINDEDSGPLDSLQVALMVPQPSLIFESTGESWLYFGAGRARKPHYDIAQLAPAQLSLKPLGVEPVQPNPMFSTASALAPFAKLGANVDARVFTHQQHIELAQSSDGLGEIRLSPQAAALLRPDWGDVRLVDEQLKQIPYLLDRSRERVERDLLRLEGAERGSEYEVSLEASPLWVSALELMPQGSYFSRSATLWAVNEKSERQRVAQTVLVNNPTPKGTATNLVLPLREAVRVHRLVLQLDDGQDAPLEHLRARVEWVAPRLETVAAAGPYTLYLGAPSVEAPRYDLEAAREVVLAVRPAAASVLNLEPNPTFERGLVLAQSFDGARVAVWVALIAAVFALGALALRMARNAPEP